MHFTPNVYEKYAAELRSIVTKRLLKKEKSEKNLRLLKIITIFSANFRQKENKIYEKGKELKNLLNAAAFKYAQNKKQLNFFLAGQNLYEIDYSIFRLLVLELVSSPLKSKVLLGINILKNRMVIVTKNIELTTFSKALIKKLNGVLIKERGESNFSIMLPTPLTLGKGVTDNFYEDLQAPFSVIDIMLFR